MLRRASRLLRTLLRLGVGNAARVVAYRLLCRSGVYRRLLPAGLSYAGPFFDFPGRPLTSPELPEGERQALIQRAERVLAGWLPFFSAGDRATGFPPDWLCNADNGRRAAQLAHWTVLNEFALAAGDVKYLWEPSRFDGLLWLAQAWILGGETRFAEGIERWLSSWVAANPFNLGVNWKCGQETGIRLMHTLLVAEWLARHARTRALPPLQRFVAEHCRRIRPTLLYAVAQDNNHATSEAVALYMGGLWLRSQPSLPTPLADAARAWQRRGRQVLEERVAKLVMPDGSFAQHSVTYHRLLLDALTLAENWRRHFDDQPFSASWYERASLALAWLRAVTDPLSGDAPNLGANDGARLLPLGITPYRDFRPSHAWAANVLAGATPPSGASATLSAWFADMPAPPAGHLPTTRRLFPFGGYVRLGQAQRWALLRLPRYRFRPSHADGLHLDVWADGVNVLRDGGTFSYRPAAPEAAAYFPGTVAHNTVEFDERDQMPRISRFLFGEWLDLSALTYDEARPDEVAAEYVDWCGARHRRTVRWQPDRVEVDDEVSGFARSACLRWRLVHADWQSIPGGVNSALARLTVTADAPLDLRQTNGAESRCYGEQSGLPVIEVRTQRATVLRTTIEFH